MVVAHSSAHKASFLERRRRGSSYCGGLLSSWGTGVAEVIAVMEGVVLTRPAMEGDDAEVSATEISDSGDGSDRAGRPLPSPFTSDALMIDALSSNLWYKPPSLPPLPPPPAPSASAVDSHRAPIQILDRTDGRKQAPERDPAATGRRVGGSADRQCS
ncbi:unnamed protein product [Urochloa humidicola]